MQFFDKAQFINSRYISNTTTNSVFSGLTNQKPFSPKLLLHMKPRKKKIITEREREREF